jgi:hypothetical protein
LVGLAAAVGWFGCVRALVNDDKDASPKFWLLTVVYLLAVVTSIVRSIVQSTIETRSIRVGFTLFAAVFAGIAWGSSLTANVGWAAFTLPVALWYTYLFLTQSSS